MSLDGEVEKYRARTIGELVNNNFKSKIAGLGMGFLISKDIY